MTEYLISDELLASIRRACYDAGKAGKEVFTVKAPSVEVVRCGECKFGHPNEMHMDGSWNIGNCSHPRFRGSIHRCNVRSTDTCAWGERREDA